jgi:CTP-dependent riboflavin kinase
MNNIRRLILTELKKEYDKNPEVKISKEKLLERIKISEPDLIDNIFLLEEDGKIECTWHRAKNRFWAKITSYGIDEAGLNSPEDQEIQEKILKELKGRLERSPENKYLSKFVLADRLKLSELSLDRNIEYLKGKKLVETRIARGNILIGLL